MLVLLLSLVALASIAQGVDLGVWTGQSSPDTEHDISGNVSYLDNTTIKLENFNFDGLGIAVILYYYPPGGQQSGRNGFDVNQRGTSMTLEFKREFSGENILAEMPAGSTVCDIKTLTVWCSSADAIFAQVSVNRDQLFENGGSGEACTLLNGSFPGVPKNSAPTVYPNCIPFSPILQVSWSVDTDNSEIDFLMCGCRSQTVNQYMAFGLSGRSDSTFMVGADATIAWVDSDTGSPNAEDYYITGQFQCRSGEGVCPDTSTSKSPACSDDVRQGSITGGFMSAGVQCVAFSRPFVTSDFSCDSNFSVSNENQYIVWAVGGLGQTAFIHSERAESNTLPIHLGRQPEDECTSSISCSSCPVFEDILVSFPDDATLRVNIGPSGQDTGYTGITGQPGWGIAWYINDTLIPILEVQRGRTYTFIIEGGTDANNLPQFHPFYITDSVNGGRLRNTPEEVELETVYAGFDGNNATGVGRLCERKETREARNIRESCSSREEYEAAISSSSLTCASGEPGILKWTPDENTPDTVFYQCATHRNLGWTILVRDEIDSGEPSIVATIAYLNIILFTAIALMVMQN